MRSRRSCAMFGYGNRMLIFLVRLLKRWRLNHRPEVCSAVVMGTRAARMAGGIDRE